MVSAAIEFTFGTFYIPVLTDSPGTTIVDCVVDFRKAAREKSRQGLQRSIFLSLFVQLCAASILTKHLVKKGLSCILSFSTWHLSKIYDFWLSTTDPQIEPPLLQPSKISMSLIYTLIYTSHISNHHSRLSQGMGAHLRRAAIPQF